MKRTLLRRAALPAASVAALALALSACGSDNNSDSSATPAASATGSIAGVSCATGSINASGSSAQNNAMTKWISNYQQACSGSTIEYAPTGSGAGITDFINNQVAFAGSDAPIADDDLTNANKRCTNGQAINIPMVGGPVAVAYNVAGVDNLVLTPQVIAQIFSNQITKWNDPAITKLNPNAKLPDATIAQFHRADSSGTSANFGAYLSAAAASDWTYGSDKDWTAPGGQGSTGSDGVASSVKSTDNSIGYMELSYATNSGLNTAEIDNGGGPVKLTTDSASKAISAAKVVGTSPDLTLSIDYQTKNPGAYPLVLVTYEIVCSAGNDSSTLPLTKSFLSYTASDQGQAELPALGYAPLPAKLLSQVQQTVASIS